jgi:hypothetical protein
LGAGTDMSGSVCRGFGNFGQDEVIGFAPFDLAVAPNVRQDAISRLEKRSDLMLYTLCRYVEGMGGKLDIVVRLPGRPPVRVRQPIPN